MIWPSSEADAPKRIAVVEEWTRFEESAHPASNNRASRGPTRARASAHPIRPHIHQLLGRNQVYPAPWGALIRSSCKSAGFGTRAEFVHPTPLGNSTVSIRAAREVDEGWASQLLAETDGFVEERGRLAERRRIPT